MLRAAAVQAAVADIHILMSGQPLPPPAPAPYPLAAPPPYALPGAAAAPPPGLQAPPPAPIMLMVNIADPPASFNLPERIRGPGACVHACVRVCVRECGQVNTNTCARARSPALLPEFEDQHC